MFRKLLISLGMLTSAPNAIATAQNANDDSTAKSNPSPPSAIVSPPYSPYTSDGANAIYNLIFCDNLSNYVSKSIAKTDVWQTILDSSNSIDIPALEALASDTNKEGRVRYLAYQKLRRAGQAVSPKILLGVIIEMPLHGGLDTLAAYSEGGIRYVNKSGKLLMADDFPGSRPLVENLFESAQPVVNSIGPWKEPRRPPPALGNVRMTFLVSDGLYFGEGPMTLMQKEQMAAPVINQATELLLAVVAYGTK